MEGDQGDSARFGAQPIPQSVSLRNRSIIHDRALENP